MRLNVILVRTDHAPDEEYVTVMLQVPRQSNGLGSVLEAEDLFNILCQGSSMATLEVEERE